MNTPAIQDPAAGRPRGNIRDQWVITLTTLLSPAMPMALKKPMEALRPHLETFADSAFTAETARAVAEAERHGPCPSWDKIAPILRKAVNDARPINGNALPAPAPVEHHRPDADEIRRIEELLANAGLGARRAEPDEPKTVLRDVSLIGPVLAAARERGGVKPLHREGGAE
jgi:hypothetical protein